MVRKNAHQDPAAADLCRAAEAAIQSGRVQQVEFRGTSLTIGPPTYQKDRASSGAEALTAAEREEILRATFGTWKGHVDADQLRRHLRDLQQDDSDPRSL